MVPHAGPEVPAAARRQDDLLAKACGQSVLRRRVSRDLCAPYQVSKRAMKEGRQAAGRLGQPNVFEYGRVIFTGRRSRVFAPVSAPECRLRRCTPIVQQNIYFIWYVLWSVRRTTLVRTLSLGSEVWSTCSACAIVMLTADI